MIEVRPDDASPALADDGLWTFEEAVQQQLGRLRDAIGLESWMLGRVVGPDWGLLQAISGQPLIAHGRHFHWKASICWRALQGQGPSYCVAASELPVYAAAPLRELLETETYLGVALRRGDGTLFGSLCGMDRKRRDLDMERHRGLLTDVARHLASLVEDEFEIARESRLASYSLLSPGFDATSRTLDASAWPSILEGEETTRDALLSPASILAVSAGTIEAARALRRAVGPDRVLAKLGDRQLVALLPETDTAQARVYRLRAEALLAERGVSARCRSATALGGLSLDKAARRVLQALQKA